MCDEVGKPCSNRTRRIRHARLAIEDVYAVDLGRAIAGTADSAPLRCASARAAGGMAADSAPTITSIDIAG